MRVVLVEDLALLRDGLTRILEANAFEVTPREDADGVLQVVQDTNADLALLDIRLPPTFTNEGLTAALEVRRAIPGFPVVVLSQHVQQLYARELFATGDGSLGYLLKDRVADVPAFVRTLRDVAQGGNALDPKVVSAMIEHRGSDSPLGRLSPREREVLALMAEGRSNAGIAEALVVTENAVGKHIHNIFTKLDVHTAPDSNRRVLAVLEYLSER